VGLCFALCFADFRLCRTYIIFSCFCFSMCVFVWFFIPETKGESIPLIAYNGSVANCGVPIGLSLEKMDELFGVTQLVEHKNADAERGSIGEGDKASQAHVERV
jgi:hypothetical protein